MDILKIIFLCILSFHIMFFFPSTFGANAKSDLNTYYDLEKKNPQEAKRVLIAYVETHPQNIMAQKELGFLLLEEHKEREALYHFLIAEKLDPYDYKTKLQIAYIYNDLNEDGKAFFEFHEAAKSPDHAIDVTASRAMARLAGSPTLFLPAPYFSDLYFDPLYLPRFKDTIYNFIFRIGRNIYPNESLQAYVIMYFSKDRRGLFGIAPSIIADNYAVIDYGLRWIPWTALPIYFYLEAGGAYNIVLDAYYHQKRWQYDVRGGINYNPVWGDLPDYADCPRFVLKNQGSFYGDFTYYSRYYDAIGQAMLREGFRFFEYKFTSMELYWKINYLFDTRHEFWNNVLETGPAIAISPYNPLNIKIRGEFTRGYYLPIHPRTTNPYNRLYNSSYIMVEGYLTF